MSDYTRLYDFSVKDLLPTGNASKLIKGSEVDGEFDALVTAVGTKSNKITSPTNGNLIQQDATGDLVDATKALSELQLRDADAVSGNLAIFDGNGDTVDSGVGVASFSAAGGLSMLLNGASWRDIYRGGWKPASFNQSWGGSRWGGMPDGSLAEAATSYLKSNSTVALSDAAARTYQAQGFSVSEATSPPAVWLNLSKVGNPQNNLTLEVWDQSGGDPNAIVANGAATAQDGVTHPVSAGWVRFVFPTAPTLSADTAYYIVLQSSGAVDGSNYWALQVDTAKSYPGGNLETGDGTPTWTATTTSAVSFILEDSANLVSSGSLVFAEGAPLNQSKGLVKPLSEFWNNELGTLLVRSSTGFTADKTIADAAYGLDHDRIVLRCNVTTGFPQVDLYESDGTQHTITGTTDLTSGTPDVAVRWRAEADGADYLYLEVDGVTEGTDITSATISFDPLMRKLGHLTIGGGFPVAPTWDEDEGMSALPSAGNWTYIGTATEASAFAASGGALYQNGAAYASTQTGYYSITPTLSNANGWTVAARVQMVDSTGTVANSGTKVSVSDGSKTIQIVLHESFVELNDGSLIGYIQKDMTVEPRTLVLVGKGSDFFLYIDGVFTFDGTGLLDAATGTQEIWFGDGTSTAGENGSAIWDYVKYYDTAWTPAEFNGCTVTEAAFWDRDSATIIDNLSGTTVKAVEGVGTNYVEAYDSSYIAQGIASGPTTTSLTETPLAEMSGFFFGSELDFNYWYRATSTTTGQANASLHIDGALKPKSGQQVATSPGSGFNVAQSLNISGIRLSVGLHHAQGMWWTNAGTTTAESVNRLLSLKSRTK